MYLRSKYLVKLSQQQKIIKSRINPEKYWNFIEYLKQYFVITDLDIELKQINKYLFRINLEIYFEKIHNLNHKLIERIFRSFFYETHNVIWGEDYIFITLNEDF